MKTTIALVAFTLLVPVAASAQGARLNLSFLDRLAERASEKQEITIDKNMLQGFGGTLVPAGPKGDAAKQVLSDLEGVYVRSYEFDDQRAFSMDDINAIRKQLSAPGWTRIVANEEKAFLISGTGDLISPDDGILAIGSGGSFALAAARALMSHTKMSAAEIAGESMRIAASICIYTNDHITVETL